MTETSSASPPTTAATSPGGAGIAVRMMPLLLLVVCGVQFLDAMDIASMAPALPRVQEDLAMTPSSLQWVVSAYALGFGGFLMLGGRLADMYNRKRLLIGWLGLFVVASLAGGFAGDGLVLVIARLVKGVAAGITAPVAMAVLLDVFREEKARNKALGTFLAVASSGFTLGLVFGGLLASLSWRLVLFLPAVVGLAIAVLASKVVPATRTGRVRGRMDVLGAVTVTGGAVALVYGLSRAATDGWNDGGTIASLVAAVVLFPVFVMVERRHPAPLLPLSIFKRPQLTRANIGMLFFGAYVGFQFVLTLFLQNELHWSPLETGLSFVVGGTLTALTARYGAALVTKFGAWPVASVGLAMLTVTYVAWVLLIGHVDALYLLPLHNVLGGLAFSAAYPALNIAAVGQAREDEQGLAAGLFNASTQVGNGIVIAATATAFALASGGGLAGYRAGLWTVAIVTAAVLVAALAGAVKYRKPAAA